MGKRKTTDGSNPNNDICEILLELAEYEKNVNKNIFKFRAYKKAAATLAIHPTRISCGKDARKLDGVGDKIAKKIDEILETGQLEKLKKIKTDDKASAITELTRITGIGPVAAQKFVKAGITSIADLEKHKDQLNHHQLIGLKYFEDFEKKIPREEIQQIEALVKQQCQQIDEELCATVCGSYRRGLPQSGDVDILLTHPKYTSVSKSKPAYLKQLVSALESVRLITDTLSHGETKYMGVCNLDRVETDKKTKKEKHLFRRMDIRMIPHDQYYCGVLYFTGSDVFNQRMRAHAQEHGFTLNEYCLRKLGVTGVPGEILPVSCEEDIFDYINFPYIPPSERNH